MKKYIYKIRQVSVTETCNSLDFCSFETILGNKSFIMLINRGVSSDKNLGKLDFLIELIKMSRSLSKISL